jgi:beta-galactosidase
MLAADGTAAQPGVGWYRRKIDIPALDTGKSIFLVVDGAMSYAMVWMNGKLAGGCRMAMLRGVLT